MNLNERIIQFLNEAQVQPLLEVFKNAHAELFLVGGTIRDLFMQVVPTDIDFATNLSPDEMLKIFAGAQIKIIETGLKHQTVTVVPYEGAQGVEITSFRGPDMNPNGGVSLSATIEEDLSYRDFTFNAMAFDVFHQKFHDPEHGSLDIEKRVIRAVRNAEKRMQEDPLRALRLVRFQSQFGFSVEPQTYNAALKSVPHLKEVSIERIRNEFSKIIISPYPRMGLKALVEMGFFELFMPEISDMVGFYQNEFHKELLFDHTCSVVERTESHLVLRLAALLHDVGKVPTLTEDEDGTRHFYKHESVGASMAEQILSRLKYSHEIVHAVSKLVETHMRPLHAGPGGVRRLIRDTGDYFEQWRKLKDADIRSIASSELEVKQQYGSFEEVLNKVLLEPNVSPLSHLAISGHDLLALGYKEGPNIGKTLRELHEKVLDDPSLNTKETLLLLAKNLA